MIILHTRELENIWKIDLGGTLFTLAGEISTSSWLSWFGFERGI